MKKENWVRKKLLRATGEIALTIIILEVALRLIGFTHVAKQQTFAPKPSYQNNEQRILCIGDSTTANQWPPYFAQLISEHVPDQNYTVIDKGHPGADSAAIAAQCATYFQEYKPDVVIAMIGINDTYSTVAFKGTLTNRCILWLQDLRIYKLFKCRCC